MRRVFHTLLATALLAALVAASFVADVSTAPDAAGVEDCDRVSQPAADITVRDGAQEVMLAFDLDANNAASVETQRSATLFQLAARGFSDDSIRQIEAYFSSLLAWYDFVANPCADALPYTGPYTNVPDMASAPFGFGGVEATPGAAFVIRFTGPAPEELEPAAPAAAPLLVSADADDGPALAHSGSESFVLAYFGAGLLAFGATALGMRRWMHGPIEA